MDCGRWRTRRSKMGERAVEEEEKVTKNNAGAESDAQDDVQNDGKEWEGKGRLVEEQDVTWRGGQCPLGLIRQHNSSAMRYFVASSSNV